MSIKVSKIRTQLTLMQQRAVYRGDIQWEMLKTGAWQSCLNCTHFNSRHQICTLNNKNQMPPPHVAAVGCQDHSDQDDIPF